MPKRADWQEIEPLGEGGQSEVFLVRRPSRAKERTACILEIRQFNPWGTNPAETVDQQTGQFAKAVWGFARPELTSELAAMKVFKLREMGTQGEQQAAERLKNEITVLQQKRSGLPELLDSNVDEKWIVTEYFAEGTLEDQFSRYRGQAAHALRAVRPLVATVASLHQDKIVHRDIKPANVFIRENGELVLGDFGIVHLPDQPDHVTHTHERVGPHDYMPPWGDLGERLEKVEPNFDVYMLGKLLWCMVEGRLKLPREWHRRPAFDLAAIFPDDDAIVAINSILDECVKETPEECLPSAQQLLKRIDRSLALVNSRAPTLNANGQANLRCEVCRQGSYRFQSLGSEGTVRVQFTDSDGRHLNPTLVRVFVCDVCAHYAFFAPGYPEEAATRDWKPWLQSSTPAKT